MTPPNRYCPTCKYFWRFEMPKREPAKWWQFWRWLEGSNPDAWFFIEPRCMAPGYTGFTGDPWSRREDPTKCGPQGAWWEAKANEAQD
jgi:hypothetical protein